MVREVIAFIVDPNKERNIIPKLASRIHINVPNTSNFKFKNNAIYVLDSEGYAVLKDKISTHYKENIIIVDELIEKGLNYDEIVEHITCRILDKDKYNEVITGVDVNRNNLTYVILADGLMLEYGSIPFTLSELSNIIDRIIRTIPHKRLIIKIGINALKENVIQEILKRIKPYVGTNTDRINLYLVEESNTSAYNPYIELISKIKDKDVRAAINIALKDGIRII